MTLLKLAVDIGLLILFKSSVDDEEYVGFVVIIFFNFVLSVVWSDFFVYNPGYIVVFYIYSLM